MSDHTYYKILLWCFDDTRATLLFKAFDYPLSALCSQKTSGDDMFMVAITTGDQSTHEYTAIRTGKGVYGFQETITIAGLVEAVVSLQGSELQGDNTFSDKS
eukprot:scaffold272353_cov36-Prasinocladus_malaysianus.AAC.1